MTMLKPFLFFVLTYALSGFAAAQDSGFSTSAPHAIIVDHNTGIVLFEKDAARPIAPASMTKIMTAEIVFDRIRQGRLSMDTEFTVSEEAWRRGGAASGSSTMFLKVGSKVKVSDLLRGVIIQSGNDACIVLAEGIAGSETAFADLMNSHAKEIGLKNSTFRNATGWPHPEHNISLQDLATLARRTISEYPEFYALYAEREFSWNNILQGNRNPILGRITGADGLKTGHTEASGYGLVGSALRGDTRRIMVVNGLQSKSERQKEGTRLMQAAFDEFKVLPILKAQTSIKSVPVFMGKKDVVEVVSETEILTGLAIADVKNVKVEMLYKPAVAPVTKGDYIADLIVKVPGRTDQAFPLVANADVKRKSAIGRAITVLKAKFGG